MTTDDSPIDMIRIIAKNLVMPDDLAWRISRENPEHFDEYMEIVEREGNEHNWISKEGYKCRIWRNHMGAWCGYVTIPRSHPMYGKEYDDVHVEVHGDLTYALGDDNEWTFGFDTAHAGDLILGMRTIGMISPSLGGYEKYRDKKYVIKETNSLSEQLYKFYLPQLD